MGRSRGCAALAQHVVLNPDVNVQTLTGREFVSDVYRFPYELR